MENSRKENRLKILREFGADKLWRPTLNDIMRSYNEFAEDASKCNAILLVTERNYFHDFCTYFLEPAFPEETVRLVNVVSGYWFKKHVREVKQKVLFIQDGIHWFASKYAPKKQRIKSLRDLLLTARENGKFLILCGYDFDMPRFRERLSLAFLGEPFEVRELRLKPLP